jgi:hypothetical protein
MLALGLRRPLAQQQPGVPALRELIEVLALEFARLIRDEQDAALPGSPPS